jgi:hypothetical protein
MYPSHVSYVFGTRFHICKTYPDEVALFQKMKKMKSDIENVKSVDVTSLPSATYNRKNAHFLSLVQAW